MWYAHMMSIFPVNQRKMLYEERLWRDEYLWSVYKRFRIWQYVQYLLLCIAHVMNVSTKVFYNLGVLLQISIFGIEISVIIEFT